MPCTFKDTGDTLPGTFTLNSAPLRIFAILKMCATVPARAKCSRKCRACVFPVYLWSFQHRYGRLCSISGTLRVVNASYRCICDTFPACCALNMHIFGVFVVILAHLWTQTITGTLTVVNASYRCSCDTFPAFCALNMHIFGVFVVILAHLWTFAFYFRHT